MHHRRQPRSAGPTSGATGADRAVENGAQMERTGGAGIFGLRRRCARPPGRFGGCTSKDVVGQRQKRGARRRRLECDEGPHHNVVPLSNGEKRPRLPENNNVIFHGANKKLESGCTDIEPQEIPWREGFPIWRCSTHSRVFVVFGTNAADRASWLVAALSTGCLARKRGRPSVYPIASRARLSIRSFDRFLLAP